MTFFSQNKEEYERFYGTIFDDYDLHRCCNQDGRSLSFVNIAKDKNEFIGSVALELMRAGCLYNIEYFIQPKYREKGYALEAVLKMIELVKKQSLIILEETIKDGVLNVVTPNIKCIEAKIDINNKASINLVKKLGFEKMGKLLFFDKYKDSYIDAEIFDLVL